MVQISDREAAARADARAEREEREKAARAEREERERAARVKREEREEREERERAARAVREEAARADRARSDKLHETLLKVLLQRDATRDDKYLPEQIVAGHAKRSAACAGISPAEPPKQ